MEYECLNLKVVVYGGELLEKVTKRRGEAFHKPINVHSVTYAISESLSSRIMWKILNHPGRRNLSYG